MKCNARSWRGRGNFRAGTAGVRILHQQSAGQAEIRAPLFEDKVVDFIAELAQITEKKVDRETLFSDPDDAVQSEKAAKES